MKNMRPFSPNTYFRVALILGLIAPLALMAEQSLYRILYEFMYPYDMDTYFYITVARGILNGFIPYKDLFETKPPGIYLMLAASYKIFESPLLGTMIQAASILVYPAVFAYIAYRHAAHHIRYITLPLSILVGGFLALFSAQVYTPYETEVFGAFAAILYFFTILLPGEFTKKRFLFAALFLLSSIGMKEPFALTITAAIMVLYANQPSYIFPRFVAPLILAALLGISIMAAMGMLLPYYEIYMQIMVRGTFITSWLVHIPYSELIKTIPTIILSYLTNYSLEFIPFILTLMIVLGSQLLHKKTSYKPFFFFLGAVLIGSALTLYTISMRATFFEHHYVFAVPFFAALYFTWLLKTPTCSSRIEFLNYILPVYITVIAVCLTGPRYGYADLKNESGAISGILVNGRQDVPPAIDNILDACGYNRYFYLGWQPYITASTRHSPYGPMFTQYWGYSSTNDLNNLNRSPLIILETIENLDNAKGATEKIISDNFTLTPPACAAPFLNKLTAYKVYFRSTPYTENPGAQ